MSRLLGFGLVSFGCFALGLFRTLGLRDRAEVLLRLSEALMDAARELRLCAPPLCELLETLVRRHSGLKDLFCLCAQALEGKQERSFSEIWSAALSRSALPLTEAERELAERAGALLGRYDSGEQAQALEELSRQLRARATGLQEERQRMGRVYCAVGGCCGLLLGIVLL